MLVNLHEAKTHLSRLVDRAIGGDEIVIARAGRPLVRLTPYVEPATPRRPGSMAGRIEMADDFDETPEWLTDAFEGPS